MILDADTLLLLVSNQSLVLAEMPNCRLRILQSALGSRAQSQNEAHSPSPFECIRLLLTGREERRVHRLDLIRGRVLIGHA